jgi:isopenicillin-N N-acyltransferase-like protein
LVVYDISVHFLRRLSILLLAISLLQGCADAPSAQPLVEQPSFPIPIIQLRGSGADIGRQHGTELAHEIQLLHDKYLLVYLKDQSTRFIALGASRLFENQLLPSHRAEVAALAQASNIDEDDTMLAQCFLDLSPMSACSTITLPASATPDHIARFGRNLDFDSLNIADRYTRLFVVHPDGRYAFAAIGWPGMIGVLSGMNEYGLTLANMEVTRAPRFPQAMPYTLLYRTVLEQCRTVDEAVDLLCKTPIQTANNLMLMDAQGNRAVVELTPIAVHVRRGKDDSALISTNHQRDQDTDTPGRCWRYDSLHASAAAHFGQIDEQTVQKMLGDVGVDSTLQSMVFEPSNRVIYLAAGTDASHRTFTRLDLTPYFRPQ